MNKIPLRPVNSSLLRRRPTSRWREVIVVILVVLVLIVGTLRWLESGTGWLLSLAKPFWAVEDYILGGNQESQLVIENQALKLKLINYEQLLSENESLRTALGRQQVGQDEPLVAKVISSPWRSPFDIVTVDLGEANSRKPIKVGDLVVYDHLALVGEVAEVFSRTAKIKLFSASGNQLPVTLGDEYLPAIATGIGGGNLLVEVPRDITINVGDRAIVPTALRDFLAGTVGSVTTDPSEPLQKVLLSLPLNINKLRWLEIYAVAN